jgi:hypothetical protein
MFRHIRPFLFSAVLTAGIASNAIAAASDGLRPIGVAAVDITPEHPVRLLGYAGRETGSQGIAQRLGAKAVVPVRFRSPAPGARHQRPEEVDRIRKAAAQSYEQLLAKYPEDSQGLGSDSHFPTAEHQPMTYGLVLSSEALRFGQTGSDESRRRAGKAMQWLLDNSDMDGDGKPGWGLPQAWDAFQDGTTNPKNHPYTITTALVLNGMLDALAQTSLWSALERERIRKLAAQVVLRWCREAWSEGYGGGFFWYSPSPDDELFAVNSPSMFLGSIMRLLREQPEGLSVEERRLILARADDQARSIVATVELRKGMPFWNYMPLPNFRDSQQPNDLVHHVYTLWGIETYRECGGQVPLPWTRADVQRSLDCFWADGRIRHFPQDVEYSQDQAALKERPAVLWSAGALLVAYARWGHPNEAATALAAIDRDYGPVPHLRLTPAPAEPSSKFYPRQASHVLWGLALQAYTASP